MKLTILSVFAISLGLLVSSGVFAHDNDTGSSKICGISNIPLDNISNATSGSNPLLTKADFLSEGVNELNTCDYGTGIAIAVEMSDGNKFALIFR